MGTGCEKKFAGDQLAAGRCWCCCWPSGWRWASLRRCGEKIIALVTGAPSEKHVAVLPFDNIGSNPENAALADGLMDSLAGRLSNLDVGNQSLWVVPTSEVRRRNVNGSRRCAESNWARIWWSKGSVQRDGNDIRLTVNLIDTKNLRQVGSAMLEDPAGDLVDAGRRGSIAAGQADEHLGDRGYAAQYRRVAESGCV